jgi:hypothetical protein
LVQGVGLSSNPSTAKEKVIKKKRSSQRFEEVLGISFKLLRYQVLISKIKMVGV